MLKRLLLFAAAMVAPTAAHADWHEAGSAHFVVYSDDRPDRLKAFAERIERFDTALRYWRGLPDAPVGKANRLQVFVAPNLNAVQRLAGRGADNVAGFYIGRASGPVAFVPRRAGGDKNDITAEAVFFHEYAHHLMLATYTGAFPAWLVEGFAEFHANVKFEPDGGVGFGLPPKYRAYGIFNMGGLSLAKMLSGDYRRLPPHQIQSIYGRGWLLTHLLSFEPVRKGQLSTYLRLINEGRGTGEAATTAFGDIGTLDRELDRYVDQRKLKYQPIPASALKVPAVAVRALGAGEAALMPIRMRSVRGVNAQTAAALVPPARKAAAAHPADPVVQGWLAEIEYDARNYEAAEAAADRALALDSRSGQALVYKGRIRMARATASQSKDPAVWREVRRWFVEASRVDNEDAEPKYLFHATFKAAGTAPTRNAAEALLYAQQLVPQDTGLRMQVVHQHMIDGKPDEARRLLGPVAYNPHGGVGREWAGRIMAELTKNDTNAALARWNEAHSAMSKNEGAD